LSADCIKPVGCAAGGWSWHQCEVAIQGRALKPVRGQKVTRFLLDLLEFILKHLQTLPSQKRPAMHINFINKYKLV
jgi:hypothetical protein